VDRVKLAFALTGAVVVAVVVAGGAWVIFAVGIRIIGWDIREVLLFPLSWSSRVILGFSTVIAWVAVVVVLLGILNLFRRLPMTRQNTISWLLIGLFVGWLSTWTLYPWWEDWRGPNRELIEYVEKMDEWKSRYDATEARVKSEEGLGGVASTCEIDPIIAELKGLYLYTPDLFREAHNLLDVTYRDYVVNTRDHWNDERWRLASLAYERDLTEEETRRFQYFDDSWDVTQWCELASSGEGGGSLLQFNVKRNWEAIAETVR